MCAILQGLFKNTEDNPVILDDDNGPPLTQTSQASQPTEEKVQMKSKSKKKSVGKRRHGSIKGSKKRLKVIPVPFEDNSEREPIHDNAAANEEENAAANEEENAAEDGDENAAEDGDDNKAENEDEMADDLFDEAEIDDDSSVGEYNSADERMAVDSCDEDGDEYPEFNELTDMENPEFRTGMLFTSGKVF